MADVRLTTIKSTQTTAIDTSADPIKSQDTPSAPLAQGEVKRVTTADLPTAKSTQGGQKVGVSALGISAPDGTKPSAFSLIPGRYTDAVALPDILKQLGTTPEGKAVTKQLLAHLQASTGIVIPEALANAILAKPERLVDALQARPDQLSAGIDALNAAYKSGKLKDLPPKTRLLPKTFDLGKLKTAPHEQPKMEPKQLAPMLWQGDIPGSLSPAQAKANMAFAEIVDRLADNADMKSNEKFRVKYGDHSYSRVDKLLEALVADGHTIEARVEHRIANFADLKTKSPDGQWLDVPAGLMVKTGVTTEPNGKGEEALVPTVHSELVFSIRKGPNTKGPGFDADIKWYQGVSGTGFFPCDLSKSPSWCGKSVADSFATDKAIEAAQLAGQFSDVINAAAKDQKLAVGGYGATGVCNDSVAIIQHLMTGRTTAYPLLMRDETLAAELKERVSDPDKRDDARYNQLAKAVAEVPSDAVKNDSSQLRALQSIPWAEGKEPFYSSVRAKEILAAD